MRHLGTRLIFVKSRLFPLILAARLEKTVAGALHFISLI